MLFSVRAGMRAALLAGVAAMPLAAASAQTPAAQTPTAQPDATQPAVSDTSVAPAATANATTPQPVADEPETIIVTGTTSKNRSLQTSSADITLVSQADIVRKAPKSVADLLELVPGVFVEGTAGAVSNNYSVRGLNGGGQSFVQLEEDGLPIRYGSGGADEFFATDVTIDRVEAVKGGSSGVLTVNGAGATINFISKPLNFRREEGIARISVQSYGEKRADLYYSAPLTDSVAFSLGGYISSSPGVRRNPFKYQTYHLKGAIEKRFGNGGFVRVTAKIGDQSDAYYADQPYQITNGKIGSVPGFDSEYGNLGGTAFGHIDLPVSTFVDPSGFRAFRYSQGVRAKTKQVRVDFNAPINDEFSVFGKARYLDFKWDFNGLFPGSAGGNGSLTSAVNYLTPGSSPLNGTLAAGQLAFPTATQFGIKDLTTGQVFAASNTAGLNGLNGNGLLEQTTLNHDNQAGHDFGSNFGGRFDHSSGSFTNSLTVGAMYYKNKSRKNQSATSTLVNDVRNDSHIYDVVALDAAGNVVGTLTDNGVISYGNWGAGIGRSETKSTSLYFNDELKIGDNLHVDFGARREHISSVRFDGNSAAINQPVPAGVGGLSRTVGSTFDGTYSRTAKSYNKLAYTVGVNYKIVPAVAVYARYAKGFETRGVDKPVDIKLYEAGVRFQSSGFTASATAFRTEFNGQGYGFIDPNNATVTGGFQADLRTDGVELDFAYRLAHYFEIQASGVFQKPGLRNAAQRVSDNSPFVPTPQFNGNIPERTPKMLYTIQPTYLLPHDLGEVYARYKYVGKIYADAGNGLALPGYGVTSAGVNINVSERFTIGGSIDNIFGVTGITEGNPRAGQTQATSITGLFYARGIVGTTGQATATLKF